MEIGFIPSRIAHRDSLGPRARLLERFRRSACRKSYWVIDHHDEVDSVQLVGIFIVAAPNHRVIDNEPIRLRPIP